MKRLTLSGYYGYGNAGDEAVLAGLAQGFRDARPAGELELVALSGSPAATEAAHGIMAADRYGASALVKTIARTDIFLSGGGSLLQDVTSAHGIFYYLGVVRLAQMLGKKTMFIAQGIGPLRLARSRRLVASVANRLGAITVRDPDSASLLREIGTTKPPIEVTADPALLLTPNSPLPPAAVDGGAARNEAGIFGVALRPWQGQEGLGGHIANACGPALGGHRALLFPMQPQTDRPAAEQFAQKWHQASRATLCSPEKGLPSLISNIASCEMMIGMRLHALILAAACGVPSVALSYDPKVDAFMQGSGQGDAVYRLAEPDPDALTEMLARVWAARAVRAQSLQARLPELRAKAARNVDVALGLL